MKNDNHKVILDLLLNKAAVNQNSADDCNVLFASLRSDDTRGYFGLIYIYNFLAESFIQNRYEDSGYLIGRIFINHERHFMMEGKGQLGYLFRDVENTQINDAIIALIIQAAFAHAIEFDLLTPPYEYVQELSVGQIQAISNNLQLKTGKRLGFKMKTDQSDFF